MLLVFTQKITPRIPYVFKHICTRILGIEVTFTSVIEEFIAHAGPKLSYGKQPMGNEFFVQSHGLLTQQGIESIDIVVKDWEETKCFFATSERSMIPFDIFSAAFYLLTRYEEYLPHVKDEFGRYPASESLGLKNNFLTQPIIDVWAYKFKSLLLDSFEELNFPKKKMTIHNLVLIQEPYAFKQKGFFRSMVGYGSDLIQLKFLRLFKRTNVILKVSKDPFEIYEWLIETTKKSTAKLTAFFLLGEATRFEESINTRREQFKLLIKHIGDYKQVGLIFSQQALQEYDLLKFEKQRIEEITNRDLQGSINTNFLVDLPNIYRNLVELEVGHDHTMVYQNTPGFRAGTCTPFLFYDLDFEIKTPLIIHPVALTAESLFPLKDAERRVLLDRMLHDVTSVNGTFSMIFKNTDFSLKLKNRVWRTLLSSTLHQND
ncbi:DUF7033 domain-containing protein [Jejudonia soesokkakensis]|uniref:DUF7033 domain-containing protein n=1 Tax=Jejudonia soesokkakensis TaxID=1323432 RepID=A0ABW2MX06_9FLAO